MLAQFLLKACTAGSGVFVEKRPSHPNVKGQPHVARALFFVNCKSAAYLMYSQCRMILTRGTLQTAHCLRGAMEENTSQVTVFFNLNYRQRKCRKPSRG